jgi:hypothetical protein
MRLCSWHSFWRCPPSFASEATEALPPLLRKTPEYGFETIGWVMHWYPIEVLVFQPIAIRSSIEALRKVIELRVVVEAGAAVSQTSED